MLVRTLVISALGAAVLFVAPRVKAARNARVPAAVAERFGACIPVSSGTELRGTGCTTAYPGYVRYFIPTEYRAGTTSRTFWVYSTTGTTATTAGTPRLYAQTYEGVTVATDTSKINLSPGLNAFTVNVPEGGYMYFDTPLLGTEKIQNFVYEYDY